MELSKQNAEILLLGLNRQIEEYAEFGVQKIIEEKEFGFMAYPPNCGFTELEAAELAKLDNNEHLKNALRKIVADTSSGVVFNLLNWLDGTSDPATEADGWTGVKLVDLEQDKDIDPYQEMLHDGLFGFYQEWRAQRGDKPWKLDTSEG